MDDSYRKESRWNLDQWLSRWTTRIAPYTIVVHLCSIVVAQSQFVIHMVAPPGWKKAYVHSLMREVIGKKLGCFGLLKSNTPIMLVNDPSIFWITLRTVKTSRANFAFSLIAWLLYKSPHLHFNFLSFSTDSLTKNQENNCATLFRCNLPQSHAMPNIKFYH